MIRGILTNDFFTLGIILCLILISSSKLFFNNSFFLFFNHCISLKIFRFNSQTPYLKTGFKILLDFNFVLTMVMCFVAFNNNTSDVFKLDYIIWLKPLILLCFFLIIKHLIEKLTAIIFDIEKIYFSYQSRRNEFIRLIGILTIPLIILMSYNHNYNSNFIILAIILLVIIYGYGLYVSLNSSKNGIMKYFFYFILYLCALEISPYIIVYKVLF